MICESVPSGMMTVITSNDGKINQVCDLAREYCLRSGLDPDVSVCSISNHLFPHAKVIGGHQKALEFVEINGKDFGLKRIKRLAVSGAFHTAIMRPACNDLAKALRNLTIKRPRIDVYSNIDGKVYRDEQQIRDSLAKHVYMPVKWEQTIRNIFDKQKIVPTFECGPQKNISTMLGMTNLTAKKFTYNIEP